VGDGTLVLDSSTFTPNSKSSASPATPNVDNNNTNTNTNTIDSSTNSNNTNTNSNNTVDSSIHAVATSPQRQHPLVDVSQHDAVEFVILCELLAMRNASRKARVAHFAKLATQLRCHRCGDVNGVSDKIKRKAGATSTKYTATAKKAKQAEENVPRGLNQILPGQVVWAKARGFPWYPAEVVVPHEPSAQQTVPVWAEFGTSLKPPQNIIDLTPADDRVSFDDVIQNGPVQWEASHQKFLLAFFDKNRTWTWLPRSSLREYTPALAVDKEKMLSPAKQRKEVRGAYAEAERHWSRHRVKIRQFNARKKQHQ